MAQIGTLSTSFTYLIRSAMESTGDLADLGPRVSIGTTDPITIANATADRVYADTNTSAVAVEIDLFDFGGARDELGRTFALASVHMLIVRNNSANDELLLYASAANGWAPLPLVARPIVIGEGGVWIWYDPTGYAVTDASSHLINLDSQGQSDGWDVIVIGKNT